MGKAVFNTQHKDVLDGMLLTIPGVKSSKMFGYPAYSIGGKMFACVYEDGISLKLPETVVQARSGTPGVTPFEPMAGRPMREWILLRRTNSKDYLNDEDLFRQSIEFLAQQTK